MLYTLLDLHIFCIFCVSLQVAGSKNDLYLNVTECYNVSLFIINECGLSNVSNAVSFPSLEAQNSLSESLLYTYAQYTYFILLHYPYCLV